MSKTVTPQLFLLLRISDKKFLFLGKNVYIAPHETAWLEIAWGAKQANAANFSKGQND
jgi:hypothetical protein